MLKPADLFWGPLKRTWVSFRLRMAQIWTLRTLPSCDPATLEKTQEYILRSPAKDWVWDKRWFFSSKKCRQRTQLWQHLTMPVAVGYILREYSPSRYQIESSQIVCAHYVYARSRLILKSIVEIKARTKILCFDSFFCLLLFLVVAFCKIEISQLKHLFGVVHSIL